MRDINRIDPFLKKFAKMWKKCPDMRFGQLISNLCDRSDLRLWGYEEENWEEAIELFEEYYL